MTASISTRVTRTPHSRRYTWRAPTHPRISGEAKHMRLSFPRRGAVEAVVGPGGGAIPAATTTTDTVK